MAGTARVFISYSRKDTDIVDRLKSALANAGVSVWLDHEQLTPGAPNWQIKVREGIRQATHLVYAASPTAAVSPFVIQEIEMARGEGKMVLPFWIRGEQWYDCTPMGWYPAQYTDGRDSVYTAGLASLLAALGGAITNQSPHPGPAPDVPARLASLGFRGVNSTGTPAIIPPLVSISTGPFTMGSSYLTWHETDEWPQHRVELTAFQIGKYPVTVAEYALAVRAGAVREPALPSPDGLPWQKQLQRPDYPVVCVSWHDAMAYVTWLRAALGQPGWRLPSEAEFEKAARWDPAHGVSRKYPWGNKFDKARCNTSESNEYELVPVGSYPAADPARSGASAYGVEELTGNIAQWTSSLYWKYPYTATDGREDPRAPGKRVARGCPWLNAGSVDGIAAARREGPADMTSDRRGFRLAYASR